MTSGINEVYKDIEETEMNLEIKKIESMTQIEMAALWRHAPSGHKYFDDRQPYFKIFDKRFKKLGGFTPEVSKSVGW